MLAAIAAKIDLRRARRVAMGAAAAITLLLAKTPLQAQPLQAPMLGDIVVTYDQSQLLPLPAPAAEIIIGNPVIADVSVQSGELLVITGKSFGITNMIALDAKRRVILERRILVKRDEARVVNLHRGDKGRQTYNCTPQCNPTVTVGDETAYFDATMKASEKKTSMSDKAADGPTQ